MKFKLIYRGEIKINPRKRREHIHAIRLSFHKQLYNLTKIPPYDRLLNYINPKNNKLPDISKNIAGVNFISFIGPGLKLLCELDIQMLHPELLGAARADIDNRLKTLFDALRRPQQIDEVPPLYRKSGDTVYTLLDDDKLITKITVNTSHLLDTDNPEELLLLISVKPKVSVGTVDNLPFVIG